MDRGNTRNQISKAVQDIEHSHIHNVAHDALPSHICFTKVVDFGEE